MVKPAVASPAATKAPVSTAKPTPAPVSPVIPPAAPAPAQPKRRGRPMAKAAESDLVPAEPTNENDESEEDELTHDSASEDSGNESEFDADNWDFYRRGQLLPPSFKNVSKQAAALEVYAQMKVQADAAA